MKYDKVWNIQSFQILCLNFDVRDSNFDTFVRFYNLFGWFYGIINGILLIVFD